MRKSEWKWGEWEPRVLGAEEKAEGNSNEELRDSQEEEGFRGPASVFWHWVFGGVTSLYARDILAGDEKRRISGGFG